MRLNIISEKEKSNLWFVLFENMLIIYEAGNFKV